MSILKSFDELNVEQQLAWKMGYDAALREPPTDAQVEAAAQAIGAYMRPTLSWHKYVSEHEMYRNQARAALEAAHNTGQTIIPDYDGEVQGRWPQ